MSSTSSTKTSRQSGRNSSHRSLLSDVDVLRWYRNVRRGSEVTADVYLRRLGGFCNKNSLEPKQLPGIDEKELSDLLLDNVTRLESEGYAGSYIKSIVKAVKSWVRHNHIILTRRSLSLAAN